MKKPLLSMILCIFPVLVLLAGCAGAPVKTPDRNPFEEAVTNLISLALSAQTRTPYEMAPAAVMPGALKSGKRFSRLEELVMERLAFQLRRQNDLYALCRQNWFAYMESRPLTFVNEPVDRQRLLRNLIVYEVAVSPDSVLTQFTIRISASDANGRAIPGVAAEAVFDAAPESVAARLYEEGPAVSPFPEGLEERPYESLDRLAFSLASELADAYRNGMWAGGEAAAHEEVRVVLYSSHPSSEGREGLAETIQDALQQAIISNRGFTCAVSQKDFGPAFQQMDFYQRNRSVFEMEASPFTAGTVLLMADVFPSRHPDAVGVALRAMWRTGPLESSAGNLIPTNVAGTYLSGFTAKAYLSGGLTGQGDSRTGHMERRGRKSISFDHPAAALTRTAPAGDLGICFYEFTEVFEKRMYTVLASAPGVTRLRRADDLCDGDQPCLCFELWHEGTSAEISAWVQERLRTSEVLAFRMTPKAGGRLDVYFDGGFR